MARQFVLEIVCLLAVLFAKESFCHPLLPDTAHCGKSFENRIYGGSETHIAEHPWTVLMRFRSPNAADGKIKTCGGSLINNRYVLTAGHCLNSPSFKNNTNKNPIRLGEWDRTTNPDCEKLQNGKTICADPHVDVGIKKSILHPKYCKHGTFSMNDIGLIRLDRQINFTNFIQPVCLPVQQNLRNKKFVGKSMYIVGWGHTETSPNKTAKIKRKATVVGIDLKKCRKTVSKFNTTLLDSQMCAGEVLGIGQCKGDSGGPLVSQEKVNNRDVYVLAGIISNSKKPPGSSPAIFTRVGAYMDWILDNLKK